MINKQLAISVVFIFINSAICTKFYNNGDDNGESSDDRILRGQYNFNHPPSVEYYNPIPVAVVYEDAIPKGKSLHLTSKEFLKDLTETTTTNEDYLENPEYTLDPYKIRIASGQSIGKHNGKVKVKPKQLVLNDYKIPVSVVYETDGVTESRKRVKYSADDRTTKTIQPRRRQQQSKKEVDTLETQTESDQVQIASKPRKRTRERDPVVPILESENYVFAHRGNFHYSYEGGDGTKAYSSGELRRNEGDEAGEAVVGGFSYKDKDGNDVSLSYTADENGYRPVGAHLPTPPPIPPAIARALQYVATATTSESVTEVFKNN